MIIKINYLIIMKTQGISNMNIDIFLEYFQLYIFHYDTKIIELYTPQ